MRTPVGWKNLPDEKRDHKARTPQDNTSGKITTARWEDLQDETSWMMRIAGWKNPQDEMKCETRRSIRVIRRPAGWEYPRNKQIHGMTRFPGWVDIRIEKVRVTSRPTGWEDSQNEKTRRIRRPTRWVGLRKKKALKDEKTQGMKKPTGRVGLRNKKSRGMIRPVGWKDLGDVKNYVLGRHARLVGPKDVKTAGWKDPQGKKICGMRRSAG